ncbi:MAG: hypothetical protein ABH885_01465 [Candidatus Omnitrophota bacterium]
MDTSCLRPEPLKRYVPLIALVITILTLVIIPFKVISYGYLPPDDALRHAGKAVSDKPWSEILILNTCIKMDSHPGWHAILGFLHKTAGMNTDDLVVFSVIFLFLLFSGGPLFLVKRPEAWIISLIVVTVVNLTFIGRLFLGRPFILTMFVVAVMCLSWHKFRDRLMPWGTFWGLAALIAVTAWAHCGWYQLALPILAVFLAKEWKAGFRLTLAAGLGILLGASFTGHPALYFEQTVTHAVRAMSAHPVQRLLVGEFQPMAADAVTALAVIAVIVYCHIRGRLDRKSVSNPVFILVCLSWMLGFVSRRFWFDFGTPAVCVWITLMLQDIIAADAPECSCQRIVITIIACSVLYLSVTADISSRWTWPLTKAYLDTNDSEQAEWLPGEDGIIYTADMSIFYDTLYKNPRAPWRYILGYESAIMPDEDLAVYDNIHWNNGSEKAYAPWVAKMRPNDRLALRGGTGGAPDIPELEWKYIVTGIWIGRPRNTRNTSDI